MRGIWRALRANPGTAAILSLGLAWGLFMHSMGWTQSSVYAQVRALASGTHPDRPLAVGDGGQGVGGRALLLGQGARARRPDPARLPRSRRDRREGARPRRGGHGPPVELGWLAHCTRSRPFSRMGSAASRARHVEAKVANTAAIVWALTLLGAVLPAIGLLFMVRWVAERIEPGYGAAAAITLGNWDDRDDVRLRVLRPHRVRRAGVRRLRPPVLRARGIAQAGAGRRRGPARRPRGLLRVPAGPAGHRPLRLRAGAGTPPAARRHLRRQPRSPARRRLCSTTSGRSGRLFASPTRMRWRCPGGAATRCSGLNSDGFFGITAPRPGAAVDLLLSGRGLLTLTPVLVMGLVGAAVMRRSGRRAEAWVIFAVAAVYFLYNMAYWQPLGGGTPGPPLPDPRASVPRGRPCPRLPPLPRR